ncbi:hypothetical protein PSP6_60013 [Paraburkholderia tropica]|nr:hypothetical protein PSP6_60013 [Paraburkholderia tropica]
MANTPSTQRRKTSAKKPHAARKVGWLPTPYHWLHISQTRSYFLCRPEIRCAVADKRRAWVQTAIRNPY